MRYATDIKLEQVIIHTLGNTPSDGLALSERFIPLDDNQLLVNYFIRHIEKSLKRESITAARFTDMKKVQTSGICKAILDGSTTLVEGSQRIAEKLYSITKGNSRITRGNLAMASFKAGNKPNVPHYLAILKIDPSDAYICKTKKDPKGKRYISLEIRGTVMPTLGESLQKCAFIQPLDPRPEYDLIILDQQSGNESRNVAKFFMNSFLCAEPAYDSRKQTENFYITAFDTSNNIRPILQPQENELVREELESIMHTQHISIPTFIERLPEPARKPFAEKLSTLPNSEFDVDEKVATKLTRKQIWVGDNDLKVIVSAEAFDETIHVEGPIHDPEKGNYYHIEINTKKWDQVKK